MNSQGFLAFTILAVGTILVVGGLAPFITPSVTSSATKTSSTSRPRVSCPSPGFRAAGRIAAVEPLFTATAYADDGGGSFYTFYHKHQLDAGNITSDLGLLQKNVSDGKRYNGGWGHSLALFDFLASDCAKRDGLSGMKVVTDPEVDAGALLRANGSRTYDSLILGHEEYVTLYEYSQFEKFVAAGGRLVVMGSNTFYAEVNYSRSSGIETYVSGHGFAFDGNRAWPTKTRPFERPNVNWFGSSTCCIERLRYSGASVNPDDPIGKALSVYGGVVFSSYAMGEENAVRNFTGTSIIATFLKNDTLTVASYSHNFGRGSVVCLCVFMGRLVLADPTFQYFLFAALGWQIMAQTTFP